MSKPVPSLQEAKALAKQLRANMIETGTKIGHAKSLELIAHQHGFRDWNTMHTAIKNNPATCLIVGGRVNGRYMSQPFAATIVSIAAPEPGWFTLELHLDEPVDVVTFDSFSNMRRRIRGTIGPKGHSVERTSDGEPHLQIEY